MCGITGVMDLRGRREIPRELLWRMNESQHHRGPDAGGLHLEPGIGLGHRRLSIIDLATGQQPLYNEDGTVVVVFNGEIYNYQSLIPELAALGHVFRTRSDTEVIVHAWEAWGAACVERFRGMFAFALWDKNRETLFLARDRLAVKPLHYALLADGQLVFGSELKSLAAHPGFRRDLDPLAIEDYFAFGYIPEPRTIYRNAWKLPPGHTLTVRRDEALPQPREYWDVCFTLDNPASEALAQADLVERLRESVRLRMISEVPLGAFLSGGVDSSAVVAMMAGASGGPVNTCSISFSDPAFDESRYARQVAELYRTNHHVDTVDTDDFDLIDTLAQTYDEPYADSSAIPTYRVCQLGPVYPKADWAPQVFRAKTTFQALARTSVEAYFHTVSILSDEMRSRLYSNTLKAELSGYNAVEVFHRHAGRSATDDPLGLVQYLDLKTYLVGDFNTKVYRASMAHSLEVRDALMDHPLVEWLATLPSHFKLRGGQGKHLLKKAMERHLPAEVLYRNKMGFAVPLARWFRGPLKRRMRESLLGARLADTGWFNARYLEHLVAQHDSGARDYSSPIWTLLMFDSYLRNAMEGREPAPAPWE